MLLSAYYAQSYASIIFQGLIRGEHVCKPDIKHSNYVSSVTNS